MDTNRFDTLIRMVAATRSRRQLLQVLATSGGAALTLRLGIMTTAAQVVSTDSGETCSQDSDCVPAEADPCTGAHCEAGLCTYTNVACLPDHICCGNGECCPAETEDPSAVESDDPVQPEATETSCADAHAPE